MIRAGSIPLFWAYNPFQRIHRNAIVNIDHVRQMTALTSHRWQLTLSNRDSIVVSKRLARNIRRLMRP